MPESIKFNFNRPVSPKSFIDEEDRRKGELQRKFENIVPQPLDEDKVVLRKKKKDTETKPDDKASQDSDETDHDDKTSNYITGRKKIIDIRV